MNHDRLVWERDGLDWPNRAHSAFVEATGLRWHVQSFGRGPPLLLVHGTGSSTHSWRDFGPLLAQHFTVVAPDLPGHGFTRIDASHTMSLPLMARAVSGLVAILGMPPVLAVGHSAGAAVLARMSLDGGIAPRGIVSLNGAFLPLGGAMGTIFSSAAKLLSLTSLPARVFAWRAGEGAMVERLLRDTGSRIDPVGIDLYRRLASNPGHVAAALDMMANWDLHPLMRDLGRLEPALLLVVGDRDRTVSPSTAQVVRRLVRSAAIVSLPGLGHLAHEEKPETVAALVIQEAARLRIKAG